MPTRPPLVCQKLDNIERIALEKFQHLMRKYIRGCNGIYAQYRGDTFTTSASPRTSAPANAHLSDFRDTASAKAKTQHLVEPKSTSKIPADKVVWK